MDHDDIYYDEEFHMSFVEVAGGILFSLVVLASIFTFMWLAYALT